MAYRDRSSALPNIPIEHFTQKLLAQPRLNEGVVASPVDRTVKIFIPKSTVCPCNHESLYPKIHARAYRHRVFDPRHRVSLLRHRVSLLRLRKFLSQNPRSAPASSSIAASLTKIFIPKSTQRSCVIESFFFVIETFFLDDECASLVIE